MFAGCLTYRGLVPIELIADLELDHENQSWGRPSARLCTTCIAWTAAELRRAGPSTILGTARTEPTKPRSSARSFACWRPKVRQIIAAAETCFIWALSDRNPLSRWSAGHTMLLGDACHPMYPFTGQGAAQAIEDGATLTACFAAGSDDPSAAVVRYEQLRLSSVSKLQAMSRAYRIRFHMPDGLEQQASDAEWARVSNRALDTQRWQYDHDPAQLG